ncbi:esterase [Oscillatoriales cyanobacterium LEGE 11467]|uniref:Esterase n=1 Tax=Zarconia navalis LEGE 11467 TaxID=1828826 RepID=A0A928VVI5_9CYAN|nr:YqiA/YcfP family alpha/beta fold hydrolase [Zarconia navalis]MBE9040053.1 esterase [Zarconia navalis LEGE 11467]
MHNYFYLHGFASGPKSAKARFLGDRFRERQLDLQVLDLNDGDFPHLTLTRQLQQVARVLPQQSATIIGSSFGGLTAAWLGDRHPQIERLILLAPAFQFMDCWLPTLETSVLERWKSSGTLSVYHFGEGKVLPLHYEFAIDCQQYSQIQLQCPIETLILHGIADEVIPIQVSRDYARTRPWVKLIELESDHGLGDAMERIWQEIQRFCQL